MTDPRSLSQEERDSIRSAGMQYAMNYGPCVVYVKQANGRFYARGYRGKAIRNAFYYGFRSMDHLGKYADSWAAGEISREESRAAARAKRAAHVHSLKVGDVLSSMWGYEQTNIDYYQVVRLVGKKMVAIRPISAQSRGGEQWMTGTSVPHVDSFTGKERRCRVTEGNSVKVGHHYASPVKYVEVAGTRIYEEQRWTAYH